jgi:predicted alpha/beta hydrolase family esterase
LNIGSLFQSNALSAGISAGDTNWRFVLSQADGVLRFAYTDLTPTNYMNFLRDTNEAIRLGDTPDPGLWAGALLTTISNSGVALSQSFVTGIATNNQGIILVEAWTNTTQPLVLTIYHGTNQIAQTQLYLSISGVEQMFRSKTMMLHPEPGMVADRLTDASVPNEPDTVDKNFVFVHGYNVTPNQARGWDADFYKRLYWSGSHAKFWAVTWEAADTQVAGEVTINLQTNIVNAFNTAPLLNTFLNRLSGTNVVAAHSLGNMVVLSALNDYTNQSINTYFMIDAAVPMEALEGYHGQTAPMMAGMLHSEWTPYANKLYASDWRQLFPINDARSTLTWSNRLANLQNADVYNFYSSGEEVLRATTSDPPTNLVSAAKTIVENYIFGHSPLASFMWVWQEKGKGRCASDGLLSSSHGGWKFNSAYDTNGAHLGVSQASSLSNAQLSTNAFFDVTSTSFGNADLALYGSGGSAYAQAHGNRILSDAIPSLTLPVGANAVTTLDEPGNTHNFDMQSLYENNWPVVRLQSAEGNNWNHSDCRQISYTFTYQLFDKFATLGNLK